MARGLPLPSLSLAPGPILELSLFHASCSPAKSPPPKTPQCGAQTIRVTDAQGLAYAGHTTSGGHGPALALSPEFARR